MSFRFSHKAHISKRYVDFVKYPVREISLDGFFCCVTKVMIIDNTFLQACLIHEPQSLLIAVALVIGGFRYLFYKQKKEYIIPHKKYQDLLGGHYGEDMIAFSCLSESFADDIYIEIAVQPGTAGYRLLNGTHQFGFHSPTSEFHGVVVFFQVDDVDGLRSCWRKRFVDYTGKYHLVLSADLINRVLVGELLMSTCIAGLIVTSPASIDEEDSFSHDGACPNLYGDRYGGTCAQSNAWNERGYILREGLLRIDWAMQILYLSSQTNVTLIRKCYEMFNVPINGSTTVSHPFCAASFGVISRAAGSSEICKRRSDSWNRLVDQALWKTDVLCSELVGLNLIAYLPPKICNKSCIERSSKYLMLAARLDSFGLIPEVSPGEISAVTSLIAMMATAHAIGLHMNEFEKAANSTERRIIIAFFDGEAFDYIGSSAAAYSMSIGEFPQASKDSSPHYEPISFSQVEGIIEVQQLGTGDGFTLYALADGKQLRDGSLSDLLNSLSAGVNASGGALHYPSEQSRMPPSSWHSFARFSPDMKGVVIAPFEDKYNYRRFNSMLDRVNWTTDERSAAISEITLAANALLRAAADFVGLDPKLKLTLKADKDFVSTLIECLIDSPLFMKCDFFAKAKYLPTSKSTYITPDRGLVEAVYYIMHYAIGSTNNTNFNSSHSCLKEHGVNLLYSLHWQADPDTGIFHCYRSPMIPYEIVSPAFLIKDYSLANTTFSTWTTAHYKVKNLRLFLLADKSYEYIFLAIGIVMAVFSFMIVYRCTDENFIRSSENSKSEAMDRSGGAS